MAYLFVKIPHKGTDYYLIWNTLYELPYTIPMDLSNFVAFLYQELRFFGNIVPCWMNLQATGVSMSNCQTPFLNQMETDFLCYQADEFFKIALTQHHFEYSRIIAHKLDTLSSQYKAKKNELNEGDNEVLLKELNNEFLLFFESDLMNKIPLMPNGCYNNIHFLCDKLYYQIPSGKGKDFLEFLFKFSYDSSVLEKAAKWFSSLLFTKNLMWNDLPYYIRKKYKVTDNSLVLNREGANVCLRNINSVQVIKSEPTNKDLLGYFNHLIYENYVFATEVKNDFIALGLIGKDSHFITDNQLKDFLDSSTINKDLLPTRLLNFIDQNGGKLLPPIYTDGFEIYDLYQFYKYEVQLIDVYSKNGDLIFSNLRYIDVCKVNETLFVFYEDDSNNRHQFMKLIIDEGKPIQIIPATPFPYDSVGWNRV
jgi:hypothetical protein